MKLDAHMSPHPEPPKKIGAEITVRISLTFQEAPDVHTLLTMTPVRERGKLVRLALERYVAETGHPAGDVEQQIQVISTWLRARTANTETSVNAVNELPTNPRSDPRGVMQFGYASAAQPTFAVPVLASTIDQTDPLREATEALSSSIKRWLNS